MKHSKKGSAEVVATVIVGVVLMLGIAVIASVKSMSAPVVQTQPSGAVAGPELDSNLFCFGGLCQYNAPISCNTASSTVFGVKNPFQATSTAELVAFKGVGNATTTTLLIGTSTSATGAASTVYGILFNGSIPTSTPFVIASGVRNGPGNSFIDAGSGSATKIVVKPNESIVGYASTTATGAGAAGFSGGYGSTCGGYIRFTRLQ